MEQELSGLRLKVPILERKASAEEEAASLREKLQQEKIQVLLKEQAIASLQGKVSGLEEKLSGLEVRFGEKQDSLCACESLAKEQKMKAQKSKEKVWLAGLNNAVERPIKDTSKDSLQRTV